MFRMGAGWKIPVVEKVMMLQKLYYNVFQVYQIYSYLQY